MPPRPKYSTALGSVRWSPKAKYQVWYCPEFPLSRLRYRDLDKLDPLGRAWRTALRDDIAKRGMKVPLMVYNHQFDGTYPDLKMIMPKPYHLRVGRNRMWCIRDLGWTHAPVVGSGPCEYEHEVITDPARLQELWPDGTIAIDPEGIHVYDKTDPTAFTYPA